MSVVHVPSFGDNTITSNIAIPFVLFDYNIENLFKLSRYREKRKRHCESSQKLHGNKIRTVFSAFGCEKQKRTTSEVHTRYAKCNCDLLCHL